ncbi:MAG: hypothetical protein K2I33_05505 [Oscillospiraceae bacterium]|nr:hypothetical protein [Oscillospiraceae bacterium]
MKKRKAERCKSYRRTKKYYIVIHSCERCFYENLKRPINHQSIGTDFFMERKKEAV